MAEVKPSPFELWQQAGGNAEEYRRLMLEHGHLVPGNPEPLPCGWPGLRADDEDSRAGAPPVAGLGDEGVLLEVARGRPATEAGLEAPASSGTAPGGVDGPQSPPRPGQPPCRRVGQAGDAGPPPALLGGGPAQAPVPDAEGLGATGTGSGPAGSARPSAALPAAGTRPARILRALAASPAPLSTPELVDLLAEGISPYSKALSWYGGLLRGRANRGHVSRAGRRPGAWQQGRAETWRITGAGRQWLAGYDEAPAKAAAAKAEAERAATEAQRAAAGLSEKLEQAGARYGRSIPRPVRARVAHDLRDAGCTHEDIGRVFGVTGEAIRQDLRLVPPS